MKRLFLILLPAVLLIVVVCGLLFFRACGEMPAQETPLPSLLIRTPAPTVRGTATPTPTPLPTPSPQNRVHKVWTQGDSVFVVEEDEALRTEFEFRYDGNTITGVALRFTSYTEEDVAVLQSMAERMGYDVEMVTPEGLTAEATEETVEGMNLLHRSKEELIKLYGG